MKGLSLYLAMGVTIVLTGCILAKSGWLSAARASSVSRRSVEVRGLSPDNAFREAAARWRRGQPNHWRMYVLQR
jgi:hypothetical protein